ncbi:RICIN domain-containing protein [Actinosynnema sp. NPDC059797]
MKRGSLSVVAAAAVALATGVVAPLPAHAAGNEVLEIRSVALGGCAGSAGGTSEVRVAPCTGGPEQKWERIPLAGDTFLLRNLGSGDCVWRMKRFGCEDEDEYQRLAFEPDGDGVVRLREVASGGFADSTGNHLFGLISRDRLDTDHQRWRVAVLPDVVPPPVDTTGRVVTVRSLDEGTCLTNVSALLISLRACSGSADQRWRRVELGDGALVLRNETSGSCVQLSDRGSNVNTWEPCDTANPRHRWRLETDPLGRHRLVNAHDGGYLTPLTDSVTTYKRVPALTWQEWELTAAS